MKSPRSILFLKAEHNIPFRSEIRRTLGKQIFDGEARTIQGDSQSRPSSPPYARQLLSPPQPPRFLPRRSAPHDQGRAESESSDRLCKLCPAWTADRAVPAPKAHRDRCAPGRRRTMSPRHAEIVERTRTAWTRPGNTTSEENSARPVTLAAPEARVAEWPATRRRSGAGQRDSGSGALTKSPRQVPH